MQIRKVLFCAAAAMMTAIGATAGQAQIVNVEEYELIGYNQEAQNNPVARLASRLESGETVLEYSESRGYFDAFLRELDIDPDSQALVFSKTSLQYALISAQTPRAVYFNDDTYIGWVKNSAIVEIATMDEKFGAVFYVFNNRINAGQPIERLTQKCLVCHDTYGMMGGGVPVLMVRSSIYTTTGQNVKDVSGEGNSEDSTPLEERWGGWYVTGQHGDQVHLGNVQLPGPGELAELNQYRIGNISTLEGSGFFDTDSYLRKTSDLVSLMIMEHQIAIQNKLTYVKFKAPVVLERLGMGEARNAQSWEELPERAQRALLRMMDALVEQMLLKDAITLTEPISGNAAYAQGFQARAVRDSKGRSLRDLDLETSLFKYPMSYLVYSNDFRTLPVYAKDYVLEKFVKVLEGREEGGNFAYISRADRQVISEILRETLPDFTDYMSPPSQD